MQTCVEAFWGKYKRGERKDDRESMKMTIAAQSAVTRKGGVKGGTRILMISERMTEKVWYNSVSGKEQKSMNNRKIFMKNDGKKKFKKTEENRRSWPHKVVL